MIEPVVTVKQGSLRGTETKNGIGCSYISFKGIPYAEPPIGHLRFKDPQPKQPWIGLRDAFEEGSQCVQFDDCSLKIGGDEDCLYLNVATTSLKGSRPVMVWIHGGGFKWGNGGYNWYDPGYFMQTNIVYVSINYRLGIFGFLQLDHAAATGNMGMKDQVAALKWVKENIAEFGGDPNNVTIFGESAGSASVHYHLLSPLSKGLFHKAIAQSGVAFNPWACVYNAVEIVHRLLARLGKDMTDPDEIVEYLRTVSAYKLAETQRYILTPKENIMFTLPFAPSIDSISPEPFLPRSVFELASEAHDVPIIIGYNSHEGTVNLVGSFARIIISNESVENWNMLFLFSYGMPGDPITLFDQNFDAVVTRAFLRSELPSSKVSAAVKEVKKFYFGDRQLNENMKNQILQCMGHIQFVIGIHDVLGIRMNAKSSTYLYRFSHYANPNLTTHLWNTEVEGAGHGDELVYLFDSKEFRDIGFVKRDSNEFVISERFIRMWTDFAKTGNPTPQLDDLITVKWEPISKGRKNYLDFTADLSTSVNPDNEALQFWKRIRNTITG